MLIFFKLPTVREFLKRVPRQSLKANPGDPGFPQDVAQGGMALGRILELPGFSRATFTADDQGDSFGADIDSGGIHGVVPLKFKSD